MREILFKAKRTDTKEWVEGYPFPSEPGEKLNRMIIFEDIQGGSTMATVEIDPETLCQFTGKTDKNGVNIFESAKVRFAEWNGGEMCWVGSVVYQHTLFVVEGGPNKECEMGFFVQLSRIPPERIEVIGNIHDEVTP